MATYYGEHKLLCENLRLPQIRPTSIRFAQRYALDSYCYVLLDTFICGFNGYSL